MLVNVQYFPAEGISCDEYGSALKPTILPGYNRYMGVCGQE